MSTKLRNLDSSLIQWIMTVTGLGPGVGELFWVAPAASATSQFETQLTNKLGISQNIYATPLLAEDAMVAYRNDVMLVMPGNYEQVVSIGWDKAYTHMIGLAGPNNGGDYGDSVGVNLYTETITVAENLNITGKSDIFINLSFQNAGANASCLAAVKLNALAAYFKNCNIMGTMASTQAATALACSLRIRGGGMYPRFIDCNIGQQVWTIRTGANQGVILFDEANTQANGGYFKNCDILSYCETATGVFVAVVGNNVLGRGWKFDNCNFDNYTAGTKMNQAFYCSASNSIYDRAVVVKDCVLNAKGCDAWQDQDYGNIYGNQTLSAATGGKLTEISE